MRVVLDTNVLISGVFFEGLPSRILEAWRDGKVEIAVSEEILEEYRMVGNRLSMKFPGVDLDPFLRLLSMTARVYSAPSLDTRVCDDRDDDKFFACALASGTKVIVSGDQALQRATGYRGIKVMSPRRFADQYLR